MTLVFTSREHRGLPSVAAHFIPAWVPLLNSVYLAGKEHTFFFFFVFLSSSYSTLYMAGAQEILSLPASGTLAIIQILSYPDIKSQPGVGPLSQTRSPGYILNYESVPEEALEISMALGKVWVVVCLGSGSKPCHVISMT